MTEEKIAKYLLELMENGGGTVAKAEVAEKLPFLEDAEIIRIFAEYAPNVCETMVAGIPCWQRLQLPADFATHLKETASNFEGMGFALSADNLNIALSLRYGKNFQKTYGLEGSSAFKKFLVKFSIRIDGKQRKAKHAGEGRDLSQIIGLRGDLLPRNTWRNYLRLWRDPRRVEIAKLRAKRVPIAEIAQKFELSETYVKSWILWVHDNMPLILNKNGLTLGDIVDE